jgi:hypothetical protein
MKKFVLLLTELLVYCSIVNAQYTINRNLELGKYADGTPVKATYLYLNAGLKKMSLGLNHQPDILLTDKNSINYVISKENFKQVAQIKDNSDINLLNNGYFKYSSFNRTILYNFQGKKMYSLPISPALFNDSLDVLIGYNHHAYSYEGDLSAYRISTGELLWKQKISHRYHWPWYDMFKDNKQKNMYYMIADSLVKLDIVTGKTIKMPFTAGVNEPLKSKFSLVKNRPIYRVDWKEAFYSNYPNIAGGVLSGTHSNVLSGDSILIADAKNLYCLDRQLNKIWVTPLPADAGARSYIRVLGEKIFLQNFGVAFQKGLLAHCGKPFVAVYDRHTGKQLSVTMPDIKNKLSDGIAVVGRTYWEDDKGLMYNNQGETEVHRIEWKVPVRKAKDASEEDQCFFWPVDTLYQYSEGQIKAIATDAHQVIVEANMQDVYLLKDDGTQQKFNADNVFLKDSKNIYSNNGDKRVTFLVTEGSTPKVHLILEFKGELINGKNGRLYAKMPSGVGVIDPQR